tara:strand:- start:519 stop:704 length:186 start_codon:yes stop_codon:yes gene_type:complete
MLTDDDLTLRLRVERTEKTTEKDVKDFYTRVYRMAENLGFRVVTTKKNTQLLAFKGDINDR